MLGSEIYQQPFKNISVMDEADRVNLSRRYCQILE